MKRISVGVEKLVLGSPYYDRVSKDRSEWSRRSRIDVKRDGESGYFIRIKGFWLESGCSLIGTIKGLSESEGAQKIRN